MWPTEEQQEKYQTFLMHYGGIGMLVWWSMFFMVSIPIGATAYFKGGVSIAVAAGIGWAGAQPTKLIRIPLFLVITPVLGRWLGYGAIESAPNETDGEPAE